MVRQILIQKPGTPDLQNPCPHELFSSNALPPLSKMKIRTPSVLSYRNINWENDALWSAAPSYHYPHCPSSPMADAQRWNLPPAPGGGRGQWGRSSKAAARRGPDWNPGQGRCSRGFFFAVWEEVIVKLKSLSKKFCLKALSSPVIFFKSDSCITRVLWQRKLTFDLEI